MRLADELAKYGPAGSAEAPSVAESQRYARALAASHYENFSVVNWLLPRSLHQHFCNLYAYCRWADDLADETGDPRQSLDLLDWWEAQTLALPEDEPRHPVFAALAETVREFDLPRQPLLDLLAAFRQDQRQTRYATFGDLLGYCRHSANPVGRLVLGLGRCHNDATAALSDSICTGLQLANFWQDVARDYDRGRIYLPEEDRAKYGYSEELLGKRQATDSFRNLLRYEADRAEEYLQRGRPLVGLVSREIRLPVRLFLEGGLAILAAIRRQRYDVWSRRPTVSKWTKLRLFARACCGL